MVLSSGQELPAERAPDLVSESVAVQPGVGGGLPERAFLPVGSALWNEEGKEPALPLGVTALCSLVFEPSAPTCHRGPHQPRGHRPMAPKEPGLRAHQTHPPRGRSALPAAQGPSHRHDVKGKSEQTFQQNTGLSLQRPAWCPGTWRGGATCVPVRPARERKDGAQLPGAAGPWVGLTCSLSSLLQ